MQVQTASNNSSSSTRVAPLVAPPASLVTPPAPIKDMQSKLAELGVTDESHSKKNKPKSKIGKQIPTILGLVILFAAMISGVFLFGQGTGVFAPRATPETTPKNITVSNVTDKSFTVSFFTDESTIGFVKYGEVTGEYKKQSSDDRDQLSGIVKDYRLHHVTVRGLQANTAYYYVLGTGSSTFDNQGEPYVIQTATKPSASPSNNQTVYGNVFLSEQVPADGAVVFVDSVGMGTLSTLVKASGSFGLSLANAFNDAKNGYVTMSDESSLTLRVQAPDPTISSRFEVALSQAQPIADVVLSQLDVVALVEDKDELLAPANSDEASETGLLDAEADASAAALLDEMGASEDATAGSDSSALAGMLGEAGVVNDVIPAKEEETIDLSKITDEAEKPILDTTQPEIKSSGLPANTTIRITVHSDTQIDETVKTDANGEFAMDVAALGENLEPGEHTATYSYTDPVTGQEVTKTYTFMVADTAAPRQLAQIANTTAAPTAAATAIPSIPYGSGNPYLPPTASITATITASASSNTAMVSTSSGTYSSGSVTETFLLLAGGFFFILAGVWSYALSAQFEPKKG